MNAFTIALPLLFSLTADRIIAIIVATGRARGEGGSPLAGGRSRVL